MGGALEGLRPDLEYTAFSSLYVLTMFLSLEISSFCSLALAFFSLSSDIKLVMRSLSATDTDLISRLVDPRTNAPLAGRRKDAAADFGLGRRLH